jgi:hypothetical protein
VTLIRKEKPNLFMRSTKWLISVVLIVYTLIIIIPPIAHGYVYPNGGDDSAGHLYYLTQYINRDINIVGLAQSYWGQVLVGVPIMALHRGFGWSIDTMFLWFNYLVLWGVGISVYLLVGKVVGWKIGLISIPIVMFVSASVLNLFNDGSIYDLMTVGVLLPLSIFALLSSLKNKKWLIIAGVILLLSVVVHSAAIFKRYDLVPQPSTPIPEFITIMVGGLLLILLLISVVFLIIDKYKYDKKEKIAVGILGILIVLFIPLSFTQITVWANRFAVDLAIIIAIFTSLLVGMTLKHIRLMPSVFITLGVIAFSLPLIVNWFGYNSAVKGIDKEVIKYVNSLPGDTFSCSSTINPLIYGRFLNKAYKNGTLPYIDRNEPMTSGTTLGSRYYYWYTKEEPIVPEFKIAKTFTDNNVNVEVCQ